MSRPEPPEETNLKLRRLFDRWSFGAVIFMMILKSLQFFRKLGIRARENGWRKVTGIFLRHEYSKFSLGSFRLTYAKGHTPPSGRDSARELLLARLKNYLLRQPELHWSVKPGFFSFGRRPISCSDLVAARLNAAGELDLLKPYFDSRHPIPEVMTPEQLQTALAQIVAISNQVRYAPARKRPQWIARRLRRWARRAPGFSWTARRELAVVVERVMSAGFVFCEVMSPEMARQPKARLRLPDCKRYRHPGWGMLCITARFTPDFSEVDLWTQFHHVTADGAPMQEMLRGLKEEWGCAGVQYYPELHVPVSRPETMYCGDGIFRACCYVDFQPLLALRRTLNEQYQADLDGPVSLAALLLWGLSHHDFFRTKKMLLPVDAGTTAGERELELLIIRPGNFIDPALPLNGFLAFQKEMNRRLECARQGHSESHEFLELSSMLHPVFYHLAHRLIPRSLSEIVGTVGISIIKDAEMFVSPMTDFQINGFMAIGSMQMPTVNRKLAGAVCICGSRPQIRCYLAALSALAARPAELFRLPQPPSNP